MRGDPPNAEPEALADHRHLNRVAEDLAGLVGSGLAAVIVVADLDDRKTQTERAFEVEKATPGQAVARRARRGGVDHLPDMCRERRMARG